MNETNLSNSELISATVMYRTGQHQVKNMSREYKIRKIMFKALMSLGVSKIHSLQQTLE